MLQKVKLWLNRGDMFGEEGADYERISIACPHATLERAMAQLEQAVARM